MTLDQLRTFYIVSQLGSFTSAASELNMDQSNVSRKIIAMEMRLRVKLFTRKARGLILTPEGQILLEEAKEILSRIDGMRHLIQNVNSDAKGTLRLTASGGFFDFFVAPHMEKFFNQYPEICFSIQKADYDPQLFSPGEEKVIAIRPYIKNAENISQEFLIRRDIKLYASPEYLKEFGVPKTLEDLNRHRLISYGPKNDFSAALNWHLTSGTFEGKTRPAYLEVGCLHTRTLFAEQGLGITTLPELMPEAETKLVPLLTGEKGHFLDFYYIFPLTQKGSFPIRRFGEFLKTIFSN